MSDGMKIVNYWRAGLAGMGWAGSVHHGYEFFPKNKPSLFSKSFVLNRKLFRYWLSLAMISEKTSWFQARSASLCAPRTKIIVKVQGSGDRTCALQFSASAHSSCGEMSRMKTANPLLYTGRRRTPQKRQYSSSGVFICFLCSFPGLLSILYGL